jgi:uncharacterized protein
MHEEKHLAHLESTYPGEVVKFVHSQYTVEAYSEGERRTLEAMKRGARIIYQATFFDGEFVGHADFLERVDNSPSELGDWSYEAVDTKLALSTKPYFIIQLCNYSEHLQRLQGRTPERGYIVLGNGEKQGFKLNDYLAYYRHVKARFLQFVADPSLGGEGAARAYPLECGHCTICPWSQTCEKKREEDDHLSLVAWMRRDQTAKLEASGITTVAALAHAADSDCPPDMNKDSFVNLRKQASLQVQSRETGVPVYELVAHDPRAGFGLLPEPAEGDVYFDMEGDPLYEPGRGLEYLFGCWLPHDEQKFVAFWGLDPLQEKTAFENFIDFIMERRRRYPAMHVYHYANYEKAALQRLADQHSTRDKEVDELLRSEVFVDLFTVVRQTLRVGEESYSIKKLERFYGLQRATDVKKGDESIVMFETWRQSGDERILKDIENYNKDDCESTALLHRWLLARREEAIRAFATDIPFRPLKAPEEPCHAEPFDGCKDCQKRIKQEREEQRKSELERTLLDGITEPEGDEAYYRMNERRRMRYLLGHMLSYHRREEKPVWWAYYHRCENIDTLQHEDKEAIGGLEYIADIAPYKDGPRDKHLVYTYRLPQQHHKMEPGDAVDPWTKKPAKILLIDDENGLLKLKHGRGTDGAKAVTALIPGGPPDTGSQRAALTRIAEQFVAGTLEKQHPASYDLLAARKPRVRGFDVLQPQEISAKSVSAVAQALDNSYLFIQGPPGSGKSTIGSQVICDLLVSGKRVGVMSNSHKAIHNLLTKVEHCVRERRKSFRGLYKSSNANAGSEFASKLDRPFIVSESDAKVFDHAEYDLAGGTSWLFTREALTSRFDYLFIDEAGQVSLADALAASACAKNVVLLGDPSQLAQVNQGTHASHADDSVLEHLLQQAATVPPEYGIFLNVSYRMQPDICTFISETMYDGRLRPAAAAYNHRVESPGLSGAGLRYLPIEHAGNSSRSPQEADRLVTEIQTLLTGTVSDDDGIARPMRGTDLIIVTPYNAQRRLITEKLKSAGLSNVAVGTVDKFQGQEAAVVLYSMATSSGDDIPRNVSFLFQKNRFNVALSRARAMCVLLNSPYLIDIACHSVEQMALINLVCLYLECANRR